MNSEETKKSIKGTDGELTIQLANLDLDDRDPAKNEPPLQVIHKVFY